MINVARQLDYQCSSNRQRLQKVMELYESGKLVEGKINRTTLRFFNSQLRLQTKKTKGRRYTIDDKIFALSLLKQSPRGYRHLQKTFALPSRRTLMAILNAIPFNSGINDRIMKSLKATVDSMDEANKYCCLLFDEMSLEASLSFNKSKDCISGFEDCGDGRKKKFADHVSVFMARGIRRKWKQPICFYFSEHGMNAAQIAKQLKLVISSLQSIGLHVVATICDQAASNTAAMNILQSETQMKAMSAGAENRCFGFDANGEEIFILYDPPHLLKRIRDNFIDGKAKFQWQHNEQVASWNDIVSLYELDDGDYDNRMLHKLTDAHIYKEKLKIMKVKNAAQVFSHRVSSTMRGLVKYG